jgi:hypothetical protein
VGRKLEARRWTLTRTRAETGIQTYPSIIKHSRQLKTSQKINNRSFSTTPGASTISLEDIKVAIREGRIIKAERLIEKLWESQMSAQLLHNAITISDLIGTVQQQNQILSSISKYAKSFQVDQSSPETAVLADLGAYLQNRANVLSAMGLHGMAVMRIDVSADITRSLKVVIAETETRLAHFQSLFESTGRVDKLTPWNDINEPSPANLAFEDTLSTTDLLQLIQLSSLNFSIGMCTSFHVTNSFSDSKFANIVLYNQLMRVSAKCWWCWTFSRAILRL